MKFISLEVRDVENILIHNRRLDGSIVDIAKDDGQGGWFIFEIEH
jgi:hypothetical protein